MNIGIIYSENIKKKTGISNVFYGTLSEILKLDKINRYYSIYENYYGLPMIQSKNIVKSDECSAVYDYCCYLNNIDILHSYWNAFYSIHSKCYKILTIYDLIPLINKEWHPSLYDYFNKNLRQSAEEADLIIATSIHTQKDIVDYYNVPPGKVNVVYCGNPQEKINTGDINGYCNYEIEGDYLMGVSSLVKYKNFERLIKSFIMFKEKYKDNPLKLVIVGRSAWDEFEGMKLGPYKKYQEDIVFTGYIDNYSLCNLYKRALGFVYVSLYEGFGLPILEAMSMGKAVVCSNITSMPEVGGDAVEYCNPYECESILSSLERIVLEKEYRQELEKKAIVQAAKFSYKRAAHEILELYKKAL